MFREAKTSGGHFVTAWSATGKPFFAIAIGKIQNGKGIKQWPFYCNHRFVWAKHLERAQWGSLSLPRANRGLSPRGTWSLEDVGICTHLWWGFCLLAGLPAGAANQKSYICFSTWPGVSHNVAATLNGLSKIYKYIIKERVMNLKGSWGAWVALKVEKRE